MLDRIRPIVEKSIIVVRSSTPLKLTTPFQTSVSTSSPLYNEKVHSANAALLSELSLGDALSTSARNYAQKVIKRSECVQVRNIIIKEEHAKLKEAVTKQKEILSGKRKIIDGKHILMTSGILSDLQEAEEIIKKRKTTGTKKGQRRTCEIIEESNDESEASQDEPFVILDCIEVES